MPRHARERRRTDRRKLVWLAVAVSAVVHAALLGFLVISVVTKPGGGSIELLPVRPEVVDVPETRPETTPEAAEPEGAARQPSARPAPSAAPEVEPTPVPVPSRGAPETATIPSTGLVELRAPLQPLVATPYGIGRRPVVRDEARLAHMRAESLVNARIASILERPPSTIQAGPVSLANGGVSVPIPWGGFIRDDRDDTTWREKRCKGEEKDGDQPGENEARRTQCG